ncbi:MAG TPA: isochorismatase family cysteine hydrolase [Bryobacteraceae bacterium]|nr:isochorismatase family cysteine hydrolase [Bryobacteraceae bacterium]
MKLAFFDIDTQLDFMLPAGALYVPGAEARIPAIARLNAHAAARGFPLVSSTDAHAEDDPEFQQWPPHCVAGTLGQNKVPASLLDRVSIVPPHAVPLNLGGAPQIIVQKLKLDLFSNPNLPELLRQLQADGFIVYGVVTEYCVGCAARGLLETGKPVWLVSDAIQSLNTADSDRTVAEFTARGGKVATVSEICAR